MISAETAKANVINYQAAFFAEVTATVTEILDSMSKSIEFHSKSGLSSAVFMPYTSSRFSSDRAKEIAHEQFKKAFETAGYEIITNDVGRNELSIKW